MREPLQLGRYSLFAQLASGGMATIYLGRLNGEVGFGRTVAIKRLHAHLAREPEFVSMFLDEAHMAARVQHPNVATTLDIVNTGDELFLVMEYVQGETLATLLRTTSLAGVFIPVPVAVSVAIGFLGGLHAAHEAKDEQGRPLGIVHRDVSPQNVLVGADGVARLIDFGVARASSRLSSTRQGELKGKVRYMSPEQLAGDVSRMSDLYAAGVVLWESLTGRRLVRGESEAEVVHNVLKGGSPPPSACNPEVSPALDGVVLRALAADPSARWPSALAMAHALDACLRPASSMAVATWVQRTAGESLDQKAALVALAESGSEPRGNLEALRASGRLPEVEATDPSGGETQRSLPPPAVRATDDVATVALQATPVPRKGSAQSSRQARVAGIAALLVAAGLVAFVVVRARTGPTEVVVRGVVAPPVATEPAARPPAVEAAPPREPVLVAPPVASAAPSLGTTSGRPKPPRQAGASKGVRPSDMNDLLDTR
jgi:serine/threonine-protein kinase